MLIFIERIIKSAIENQLTAVKANKDLFDAMMVDSGLTVREQREFWDNISASSDPFNLKFGYTKQGDEFPSVRITLASGEEDQQFLDGMILSYDGSEFPGAHYSETYQIIVYSFNVDQCMIWHKFIKGLLILARQSELKNNAIMVTKMTFNELNPAQGYIPEFPYIRSINMTVTYQEYLETTFDIEGTIHVQIGDGIDVGD